MHVILQAKALVDPFAYDAYIEQRKKEKLDEERANRITVSYFFSPKLYDIYYLVTQVPDQLFNILVCLATHFVNAASKFHLDLMCTILCLTYLRFSLLLVFFLLGNFNLLRKFCK